MKKIISDGVLATSLLMTGCIEQDKVPNTTFTERDVYSAGHVTRISQGESAFVTTIDSDSDAAKHLKDGLEIVDFLYPKGSNDSEAPNISSMPIRTNVRVTLKGKGPSLSNDGACDSYPIESNLKYVGAVAIGGSKNGVVISWPEDSSYLVVCAFQKMEPDSEDGLVVFATNNDR